MSTFQRESRSLREKGALRPVRHSRGAGREGFHNFTSEEGQTQAQHNDNFQWVLGLSGEVGTVPGP